MTRLQKIAVLLVSISMSSAYCQKPEDVDRARKEILEEGIFLFRLEKASWHASDVLMKNHRHLTGQIRGYLSYADGSKTRTIFWNAEDKAILSVTYDSIASADQGLADDIVRPFTPFEADLVALRTEAFELLMANTDEFFAFYEKTSPNLITLIKGNQRVVFILTGSQENALVVGNDYKLVFDKKNKLMSKVKLHNSLIRLPNNSEKGTKKDPKEIGSVHSHVLKDHPFMTSTDICTFLLYRDVFNLSDHLVISEGWTSIFNASKVWLVIVARDEKPEK